MRLARAANAPLLVTTPDLAGAEKLAAAITELAAELELDVCTRFLPETVRGRMLIPGGEAARAAALSAIRAGTPDIVVGSIHAALAPVPPPESPFAAEFELATGDAPGFSALLARLVELDYDDEIEASAPGEFARRGGIVDVFSPAETAPCRIEFFGDEIESMRRFDPATQRTTGPVSRYRVVPPHPSVAPVDDNAAPFDLFELWESRKFHWLELQSVTTRDKLNEYAPARALRRDELEERLSAQGRYRPAPELFDSGENNALEDERELAAALPNLMESAAPELRAASLELLRELLLNQLRQLLAAGWRVTLLAPDEATLKRLAGFAAERKLDGPGFDCDRAGLGSGILLPRAKLALLTEHELFTLSASAGTPSRREKTPDAAPEQTVGAAVFTDLDDGDLAVHLSHGIGIFRGLREIEHGGARREMLVLEYRDGQLLYVPLYQAHMVSRYFGSPGKVKLNSLKNSRWSDTREEARLAIRDYAAELLRMQAVRDAVPGVAFSPDSLDMRLFESEFPFADTPDQARATREIKRDMESAKPMDRLLCGDVGYGKTELAMRAAFKAVHDGFQVVVLAPTTVLVEQHLHSFRERFAAHPYIIESLSRFRTPAEQREIIRRLREGTIDILIGTHRLCGLKPADFKNLGLLVIDEEQRFGVRHKEELRRFRTEVDVLTMSATPIPRTLYLAMAGTRDLSTLMTAPVERRPVKTVIAPDDDAMVVSAIRAELARGGQVYYLYNRVRTIRAKADKLAELLPGVRFAVAHGQMEENELEAAMTAFLEHRVDCLVCSTIIESGLDIPNANTILIERADRFGLAELYQLRGRVGRWIHQAYAYLLLPRDQAITADARKRIAAIRRCTQLGSAFQLAMRDLEIRGAGNLLGVDQSGHLDAIGFDLYCQLLHQESLRLAGKKVELLPEVEINIDFVVHALEAPPGKLAAALPPAYIPGDPLRVAGYRKLAAANTPEELANCVAEFTDRFGNPPETVRNLYAFHKLRVLAARAGRVRVAVDGARVLLFDRSGRPYREQDRIPQIDPRNPPRLRLKLLEALLERAVAAQAETGERKCV